MPSISPTPLQPRALSRPFQTQLRKLRRNLAANNLLHVLESLPTDIVMQHATLKGSDAIGLSLGSRSLSDGTMAPVCSYIQSKPNDTSAPVYIYYAVQSPATGLKQILPRTTSWVVRKAGSLLPPFQFLQYNPTLEETRGGGDMLSALLLYYALSAGHGDAALRWPSFEDSFHRALTHIEANYEYHDWMDKRAVTLIHSPTAAPVAHDDPPSISKATPTRSKTKARNTNSPQIAMKSVQNDTTIVPRSPKARTGIVSLGSAVKVKAGTVLAEFGKALGKKDRRLLDSIPRDAVFIEKQTALPNRLPYRLRLGSHSPPNDVQQAPTDVHVYSSSIFTFIQGQQQDGTPLHLTYATLQDVKLYEPFASLRRMEKSTHANKTRALVKYFLMLAENEGLIDAPPVDINMGFLTHFRLACADLRKRRSASLISLETLSSDSISDLGHNKDDKAKLTLTLEELISRKMGTESRIVKLKLNKALLAGIERIDTPFRDEAVFNNSGPPKTTEVAFVHDTDSNLPAQDDVLPSIETDSPHDTTNTHNTLRQPSPSLSLRLDTAITSAAETESLSPLITGPGRGSTGISTPTGNHGTTSPHSSLQSISNGSTVPTLSKDVPGDQDRIVIDLRSDDDGPGNMEVAKGVRTRLADRTQGLMGTIGQPAPVQGSKRGFKRNGTGLEDLNSDGGMMEISDVDWKASSQRRSARKKARHSA